MQLEQQIEFLNTDKKELESIIKILANKIEPGIKKLLLELLIGIKDIAVI